MGWTVGLEPSRVGRSGHVWDVPGLPGTLGWDGTVGLEPSRVGQSRMSLGFPGLWDGMEQWD